MLSSLVFLLFGQNSFARDIFEYQRPAWALGMGGVYTPFPRTGDIPTANPAYLSKVKEISLELLNLEVKSSGLKDLENFEDLPDIDGLEDLETLYGKPFQTGGDGRLSIVAPNFGFSGFTNVYIRTYFSNPLVPEWYVNYLNDYGLTVAFAKELSPELSVGIALKRINRTGGDVTVGLDKIQEYIDSDDDQDIILDLVNNKGIGYGVDLSLLNMTTDSSPTITTLVWKDVGRTTFQKEGGLKNPPSIRDNLILGLGYVWDGPGFGFKTGLEFRHLLTSEVQFGNKIHTGIEFSLPLIDLRAGLSQGYMTYGAGIDLWILRVEAAQFTEEFGAYPGQTPETRLQLSVTIDLSVDADFNFTSKTGANGKRAKLKQRR